MRKLSYSRGQKPAWDVKWNYYPGGLEEVVGVRNIIHVKHWTELRVIIQPGKSVKENSIETLLFYD